MRPPNDELARATALLAAQVDEHVAATSEDAVGARQVLALEAALAERGDAKRRRSWPRVSGRVAALSLAAMVALYIGATSMHPTPGHDFRLVQKPLDHEMFVGRIVRTGSEPLFLRDGTGSELQVHTDSELHIAGIGAERIFDLKHGTVQAHVAKLVAGTRLVVRTDDTEVEVRGTKFSVRSGASPECDEGHTRVEVEEGVVSVRRAGAETKVAAGETFPRCEARHSPEAPMPQSAVLRTASPSPHHSLLAQQNDLFANAMGAKGRGDALLAETTLARLILLYPSGPLVENAYAQRMTLQAGHDASAAKATATAYLAKFPEGFACARARELLDTTR